MPYCSLCNIKIAPMEETDREGTMHKACEKKAVYLALNNLRHLIEKKQGVRIPVQNDVVGAYFFP